MTNSTGLHHSTQAGRQTHGNHMNMSSPEYDSSEGEDSDEEMLDRKLFLRAERQQILKGRMVIDPL